LIAGLLMVLLGVTTGAAPVSAVSVWPVTTEKLWPPTCTVTSPKPHEMHVTCMPDWPATRNASVPRTAICEVAVTNL
jgi:hypothetical protein